MTLDSLGETGRAGDVIVEGAVVDGVSAALVELPDVHDVAAVALERRDAFIRLHHATCKGGGATRSLLPGRKQTGTRCLRLAGEVFGHPDALVVLQSGVFHPRAERVLHLAHGPRVDQGFDQAL